MPRTRVGLLGSGWAARLHARLLSEFADVQVAAVASRHIESAARLAGPLGAAAYADYRTMLDESALDAVFVCVPPDSHGPPELLAAERGLGIFVEKPLGLDVDVPERIAARIRETGVVSSVGYQMRYLDVVDDARGALAGHLPALVRGSWLGGTPGASWWVRQERSGGQIIEQATHLFDLARFLVGEPEVTSASGRRLPRPELPLADILVATQTSVRFAAGAVGSFETTCLLEVGGEIRLQVVAEDLSVAIEPWVPRLVVAGGPGPGVHEPGTHRDAAYSRQDRAFIDAVQGKANLIRSSYDDALLTQRLTVEATRLAEAEAAGGPPTSAGGREA
jgi:myo-inositol 2-dehydrogenase/D-chiro-inositol 1-dehydrogenase